jgi:MSHA biogenesis protein MshE
MATQIAAVPKSASKFPALGNLLVDQGFLTPEKLAEALAEQERSGRLLGRVLVENRFVTEEQLARTLAGQLKVPTSTSGATKSISRPCARSPKRRRRFRGIVLEERADTFLVGMVDPFDLRAQDEISALLKRPVDVGLITNEQLVQTIDRVYRKTELIGEFAKEVEREIANDDQIVDLNALDDSSQAEDAPVVRLLQTVFDDAVQVRASDIHIEPQEKKLVVRFRIDGVLHPQLEADPRIASAVLVRLKLMAGLDIAEKRLPQDGRIAVRSGTPAGCAHVDHAGAIRRVVVLRVLMREGELIDLAKSGMPAHVFDGFKVLRAPRHRARHRPHRQRQDHHALRRAARLNDPGVKILTCEDPVEHALPAWCSADQRKSRPRLRACAAPFAPGPDVLLVGEIRDQETAQIAVRAR